MLANKDYMNYALIIACLFLLSGTAQTGGCLTGLFGFFVLVILLAFLWEHIILICGVIICILVGIYLYSEIMDYIKYRDEIPEERAERIKLEEMKDEWRKRNHF